jgi:hypothetical protein
MNRRGSLQQIIGLILITPILLACSMLSALTPTPVPQIPTSVSPSVQVPPTPTLPTAPPVLDLGSTQTIDSWRITPHNVTREDTLASGQFPGGIFSAPPGEEHAGFGIRSGVSVGSEGLTFGPSADDCIYLVVGIRLENQGANQQNLVILFPDVLVIDSDNTEHTLQHIQFQDLESEQGAVAFTVPGPFHLEGGVLIELRHPEGGNVTLSWFSNDTDEVSISLPAGKSVELSLVFEIPRDSEQPQLQWHDMQPVRLTQ